MTVKEIKIAIEQLPDRDFIQLSSWFDEYENAKWDREIEEDQKHGKLDFLIKQALQEIENGEIAPL